MLNHFPGGEVGSDVLDEAAKLAESSGGRGAREKVGAGPLSGLGDVERLTVSLRGRKVRKNVGVTNVGAGATLCGLGGLKAGP